jgi:hypothetical protein
MEPILDGMLGEQQRFDDRAVVRNEGIGGFYVAVGERGVHVSHSCLGCHPVPMARKALVPVLPSMPEAVYVSCRPLGIVLRLVRIRVSSTFSWPPPARSRPLLGWVSQVVRYGSVVCPADYPGPNLCQKFDHM